MEEQKRSWKESTRRTLVKPDPVILKATGGECWIKPKKLSQGCSDRIRELNLEFYNIGDNRTKYKAYREIEKRMEAEGKKIEDADPMLFMEYALAMDPKWQSEVFSEMMRGGIGAHNFVDDSLALIGDGLVFDEKTITDVLEWGDLAVEIAKAIQEWNRPLAGGSEEKSKQ
jgi:hypothetical protein